MNNKDRDLQQEKLDEVTNYLDDKYDAHISMMLDMEGECTNSSSRGKREELIKLIVSCLVNSNKNYLLFQEAMFIAEQEMNNNNSSIKTIESLITKLGTFFKSFTVVGNVRPEAVESKSGRDFEAGVFYAEKRNEQDSQMLDFIRIMARNKEFTRMITFCLDHLEEYKEEFKDEKGFGETVGIKHNGERVELFEEINGYTKEVPGVKIKIPKDLKDEC